MDTPFQRFRRYLRSHPRAFDAMVATLLLGIAVPGSTLVPHRGAWWPGMLEALLACGALLWRRSHPRVVVVATAVVVWADAMLGYLLTPLLMAPLMVALFSLATRSSRRTANAYTLAIGAVLVPTSILAGPAVHGSALQFVGVQVVGPPAWLLLPTALGTVSRVQRELVASAHARAEAAERTREEEARLRVTEERMRIARELHDVVAHHLALANAQAGAAAHIMRSRPEQAQQMVTELTRTTSAALRELKATVGLLRNGDEPGAPLEPAPGLAQLPRLAGSFESTGLIVEVTADGEPQPLSPGVDLTAFRIVQEALTNVAKHAAAKSARVRLGYGHDRVRITVTNDTAGSAPAARSAAVAGPGYGLLGMRERAGSVGGRLSAGPLPDGGFEVAADLPYHPSAPEEDPRS
jgi:signal transduction histidine kinase